MEIHKIQPKYIIYFIFTVLSTLILLSNSLVGATADNNLQSILNNTPYYNPNAASCVSTAGTFPIPTISASAATSGGWTQGPTSGPYYMEEFAINVLEDVASKTNTPVASVLTQEHVIALIGWFYREGGDIGDGPPSTNLESDNLFNPLNTSIQDSTIETTVASGGLESFLSFNDGVEGTARTIVGSYQDRIAGVLTEQSSTAEQVADTIADFQDYPGNLAWASPGGNPTEAQVIADNQDNYLPSLLQSIEQVRANYDSQATLELGTTNAEALIPADHVSASLLQYKVAATGTTATQTSSTSSCTSNVACNGSSSSPSGSGGTQLSPIRQEVVCLAENELATHWTPVPTTAPTQTTGLMYYVNYTYQDAEEEWCADFVSWIYKQAQDPFTTGLGGWDLSYVGSIYQLGASGQGFTLHPYTESYTPVPGDIAIFSWEGETDPNYDHTGLVTAVNTSAKTVEYIGGDETNPDVTPAVYGGANSNSIVAKTSFTGYLDNDDILGYVSPN